MPCRPCWVIAEQTLDPLDPLELVCRGCRRKAILNARSAECALLLELEDDTAHMLADFVRIGGRPSKAIMARQRQVAAEVALRIESLDRCLQMEELECRSCGACSSGLP